MRTFAAVAAIGLAAILERPTLAVDAVPEPVKAEMTERVEVRLVTIDVIALDQDQRTVPGLGKDAFRLYVDKKETAIDTLDAFCGDAPLPEPRSKRFGRWTAAPDLSVGVRRIVLAFDYLHLPQAVCPDLTGAASASNRGTSAAPCMLHTQALQAYQDTLAKKPEIADEEIMVVALTGGLRVEQPFTKDRRAVLATLRRMEYDITLWNGRFESRTEYGFFRGLEALTTLLQAVPGTKSVVLLTAGEGPDNAYDASYQRLALMANDAQAKFYPIDCRGFTSSVTEFADPDVRSAPSPKGAVGALDGLARLAETSGGRLSPSTNDFTLAYARARRDLGCVYTIGFYDRKPKEDRPHALRVESAVPGVRVSHPSSYSFASQAVRRERSVQAAYMVPSMFEGGGMRAQVFPLDPRDDKSWDVLIAIDFPVLLDPGLGASKRDFGAVLSRGAGIAREFGRSVTLEPTSPSAPRSRRLTFLEPAVLSPGKYTLTAVLSDAGDPAPFTAHVELTVPALPSRGPFLVGPMIGRRRGSDVVIHGAEDERGAPADRVGSAHSFRPLLVTETDRTQPLFALTEGCVPKKDAKRGPWTVSRSLATANGGAAGSLDEAFLKGDKSSAYHCSRFVDEIPVSKLRWGAYTFAAVLRDQSRDEPKTLETRSVSFLLYDGSAPVAPSD